MPKIDSVDFFYLSMPEIQDIGDGSQDALLVRISAGSEIGWGECEASPLVSIASLVCPMSHSACKPVIQSVINQPLNGIEDIRSIHRTVRENSLDLLQADHTLSGIDIALWDLLGKLHGEPVYRLLGYPSAYPKLPYASVLFGDSEQETYQKARRISQAGFRAAKFGWGPFGRGSVQDDRSQVMAAREGLGKDHILLIDAGTIWGDDIQAASDRIQVLQECHVTWLEEPFYNGALSAYLHLASLSKDVQLAGGEGSHNEYQAQHMIDYGHVGYIQIDSGRIGGLTSAKRVADYAHKKGVTYVNHTFTSHLALSASIQPYAGLEKDFLCEYPVELKPLAYELSLEHLIPDHDGYIRLPEKPGLGITPDLDGIKKYLVDVDILVNGKRLYQTPILK
jgi:L-alanine-DL-glutamate epimerase-like enolase superfamily enzyme